MFFQAIFKTCISPLAEVGLSVAKSLLPSFIVQGGLPHLMVFRNVRGDIILDYYYYLSKEVVILLVQIGGI